MDHRNGGLFMVFDKNGNNIPAVLGAAYYFYSKTKAIEYAMTIWRAGGSSGTIPVVYVQPGQEEERVFVDNSWIPSQSLSASIYRIPWNLLTFALSALEGLMEATTGEIRSGLFRVINPGMGIPGVHHAMYWYTEAEATACAIRIWNAGFRMGGPLVDFVQPGEKMKRIYVDYDRLREETPPP